MSAVMLRPLFGLGGVSGGGFYGDCDGLQFAYVGEDVECWAWTS